MKRLCVFCGSSPRARPANVAMALALGRLLADRGIGVVYGGASVGLMGAVADGALAGGGEVIGVIPRALAVKEIAHTSLTELHIVETMHERKALMSELSGGFVALPGGIGTLEEIFEAWTWGQLGIHQKPVGILDVRSYYASLLAFLDDALAQRFVKPEHRAQLVTATEPDELLEKMLAWKPLVVAKWMTEEET